MDRDGLLFIFILIKLSGAQNVNTVRTVSVQSGQSIIIPCLYKQKYDFSHTRSRLRSDPGKWSDQSAPVISEDSRKVLTVHMEDVRESAQFSCPAAIPSGSGQRENFSLEVTAGRPRLSVQRQSESASEGGGVRVSCAHHGDAPVQWCQLHGLCVTGRGTIDGASVEITDNQDHVMTVMMSKLKMKNTGWYLCSTRRLQMPVHITVHNHTDETTPSARKRTAFFFLLPVILEILLIIIIYSALKLLTFIKERFLRAVSPAEEGQYVIMHREQASHACEEAYEIMAELTAEATGGDPLIPRSLSADQSHSTATDSSSLSLSISVVMHRWLGAGIGIYLCGQLVMSISS
ncbi:uncharacterized protein LOC130103404 [Rhinichthys klamathensis goyatoka]|uniref:uncharacterized protein LOC130103404 n=1 Tax=Rhinichthys klamathensis goyatoka TaxID=3034132 RepID=UPI0024B5FFF2|nr:uncharacterized protein LOC130103404 [Rhinichthys klamathensis goyatoka]